MSIERVTGTDAANLGLDELVARGADVHIERMNGTRVWLSVRCGEDEVKVWFSARGRIVASVERNGKFVEPAK